MNTMPEKIHNNKYCYENKSEITPNKENKCPICKSDLAEIIFEDSLIHLLKSGRLYVLEPRGIKSYKSEYRDSLNFKE